MEQPTIYVDPQEYAIVLHARHDAFIGAAYLKYGWLFNADQNKLLYGCLHVCKRIAMSDILRSGCSLISGL